MPTASGGRTKCRALSEVDPREGSGCEAESPYDSIALGFIPERAVALDTAAHGLQFRFCPDVAKVPDILARRLRRAALWILTSGLP
jgi:hypothetical protein